MKPERDRTAKSQNESDEILIIEDLCEYQTLLDRGEAADTHTTVDELISSDLKSEVNEYRNFLEFLDETRNFTDFPEIEEAAAASAEEKASKESVEPSDLGTYGVPSRIGRFRIAEQIGYGGFGVVFRGIDPVVGRAVAIKVPRPELLASPELVDRFAREASMVARLEHPNIVSIYESSCYDIVPYIVMSYVPGKTLSKWRAEQSYVSPTTVAKIVRELALAVAHAHERGVLHRDLKPGNIILGPRKSPPAEGELEFVPVLTDFGMAHFDDVTSNLTRTGMIIGTTGYLSPEQAEGRSRDITARTDVYGLGTVLYELLTGAPPFHAATDHLRIQKILHDEPMTPRTSQPSIPIDLEVICLKCLEKTPANRYPSAQALADDLERFLNQEPINARPISTFVRVRKWIRRNPTQASLFFAIMVAMIAAMDLWYSYNSRLGALLRISEIERISAHQNEVAAIQRAYNSDMRNAKISLDRGNLRQMLKLLERHRPIDKARDVRDFAWWYLWREYNESSIVLSNDRQEATAVAVTRNGDLAASAGANGAIRFWSIPEAKLLDTVIGNSNDSIETLNFSADGKRLVSGGRDGVIRVWDMSTFQEQFATAEHKSPVYEVAFSPQGHLIASAGGDSTVRLWDSRNGTPVGVLFGHFQKVSCLSFHPTEPLLASGSYDATIRFWNLNELAPNHRIDNGEIQLFDADRIPRSMAFESNGKSLMVGIANSETRRYSTESSTFGCEIDRHVERSNPLCIAWPPVGPPIVALGNSEIRVADAFDLRRPGRWYCGHFEAVLSIAAPSDGSFLLSASQDGTVRYWPRFHSRTRISVEQSEQNTVTHDPSGYSVQWGNKYLASDFQDQRISIYRMPERALERTFPKEDDADFVLSGSGDLLMIRRRNGQTTCYRVFDGTELWTIQLSSTSKRPFPGSSQIDKSEQYAMVTCDNQLIIISIPTAKVVCRLPHPEPIRCVQFLNSACSTPAAITTCNDGSVRFWDVITGECLREEMIPSGSGLSFSLAVSDDQQRIAFLIGGNNPAIHITKITDCRSVEAVVPIPSRSGPNDFESNRVAFLAGSKLLVRSNAGLSIWDIEDEAEVFTFPEFEQSGAFGISPDGYQAAIPKIGAVRFLDGRPK